MNRYIHPSSGYYNMMSDEFIEWYLMDDSAQRGEDYRNLTRKIIILLILKVIVHTSVDGRNR